MPYPHPLRLPAGLVSGLLVALAVASVRAADPAPAAEPPPAAITAPATATGPLAVVCRLHATGQAFSFAGPWQKRNVVSQTGLATLVGDNLFLAPATLVQDRTQLELEKLRSGSKTPAEVVGVDYEANLALLRGTDASFAAGQAPLALVPKLAVNDAVAAWQFESNGEPVITAGRFRRAEVSGYPYGRFLAYELEIALPLTDTPTGTPVVANGQLVGLLLSHNAATRSLVCSAPEVIRHFLEDSRDGKYAGFPQAGFSFAPLDDPQLRAFLKLPAERQGGYLTTVRPGSPAALAGLKPGDVLLAIDDYALDRLGEYQDPDHGRLNLSHLLSTRSFAGERRTFKVWRAGQELALPVTLTVLRPEAWPVEPFIFDREPSYVMAGGLLFMELSRPLLREWGSDWQKNAPPRLLHLERTQWERCQPGEKIILLTRIIKTPGNGGYDELALHVLRKVNGVDIKRLGDIPAALARPERGEFQTFEFDSPSHKIVLDARQMAADDLALRRVIRELVRLPPVP